MARAIDADNLADGLKYHYQPTDQECDYDRQWAVGYNAGLNRALYSIAYARTIEPKQEWISAKVRPPKVGEEVLVYWDDGFEIGSYTGGEVGEGVYWMPLPEPPEREEK